MDECDLGKSTVERRVKPINETGSPRDADSRAPEQNRMLASIYFSPVSPNRRAVRAKAVHRLRQRIFTDSGHGLTGPSLGRSFSL